MASISLTTTVLSQSRRGSDDGELILDAGGGRMPTPAESELLGCGSEHADRYPTALPYRSQDGYTRELEQVEHRVAVLENDRIRATFLLDLGGRLWNLVDLTTGRDALHQPDAIRMANLAIRNAWFAGGVEWNLGVTGHWGLTCEKVSAGVVEGAEGDPVLRLWAHERLLGITWRIDVALPDGSDALFVHPVITNHTDTDLPVYWWSNIAVPQSDSTRVLVDSDSAFHFGYADALSRVDVPVRDGVDITRPARHRGSADYFFLAEHQHPWIAAVDDSGAGLGQASTAQLRGRKLFTWGGDPGGETWQRWLSGPGAYAEIQAGLARTQLEHLRLAAGTTWRFTESYRPISVPGAAEADWDQAVSAARTASVEAEALDAQHARLTALENAPVQPGHSAGDEGWGALEVAAEHRAHDPATPYDPASLTPEQGAWLALAEGRGLQPALQRSAVTGRAWRGRLEDEPRGWLRDLLLGHIEHADGDTAAARELWSRSAAAQETPDARRALGVTTEDPSDRAEELMRAHQLDPHRRGIAVEALSALLADEQHDRALDLIGSLTDALRALPRIQYLEARARVAVGDAEGASRLLDLPLVLPDLREGDVALDQLWFEHQQLTGSNRPLPAHYDFRMSTVQGEPS